MSRIATVEEDLLDEFASSHCAPANGTWKINHAST